MPNYRKKNNNNHRNKNKNKNKNTSSSSIKQETRIVESTTTSTSTGIEPNLPADVRNSYISTTSAKTKIVVVNVDEASNSSSVSNEEIGNKFASSNIDIDTLSDLATPFSSSEDTNSILKQSSQFYSSSTSSSSSCSKKSTEIENQQLNRAVFDIGDSTLTDSVIKEAIVRDNSSSGKNSLKTGSVNSKDASAAASSTADLPPAATQSIETSRIDESVSERVREVIESSKEDQSSKVIVHKVIVKNGSEKSVTTSSTEPSRVIVHQISKDDHDPQPQTIIHQKEESSSSSSHRASKNGVDLSKKTSTKAAESSTTQTLSFSNVRGQPTRQMIYEHPQRVMVDNFSRFPDPSRAIIHQISREGDPSKVIVHQISREEKQSTSSSSKETVVTQHTLPQTTGYTSIVHQITPITPISADFHDHTDHSIFQKSFAESTSSKKETKDTQTKQPSEHQKRVVLIPIVQENSTQTSPLPSYSDNTLHSSLLEVIKDENSHPPSSHRVEVPRQTSSSPLSRSPVICFENLSESFELNKEVSEETPKDNSVPQTSEKPSIKASDHLEPLRIPAFPIKRPQKIILHPIINEVSGKPVFPYSEKTLETIDTSSKEIASRILKEVSCELKSSFMSERTTKKTVEEEKTFCEPIRTSFPVSIKKQSSFRPGFFETDVFQKEVNPLGIEAKVIVHKIAKEETKSTDCKQKPTGLQSDHLEKKVTVHEISNDLHIEETRSEEESYQSRINSMPSKFSPPDDLKTNKENIDQEQAKVIVHQKISVEESAFESKETKKIIEENNNEPNVILHQIARSPSFPLTSETKGEIPMKSSIQPKGSFPLSALKVKHPDQYCASSEKKTINFEKFQKNKDQNIQAQKIIKHKIVQPGSEPTFSSFPLSGEKQKKTSFISQTIGKDKVHSASVGSSFPISTERESHESQYTSRPGQLQAKSIDLNSLRDSADLRQSSSTLTSTFGLPETEKRIEIIHQILQDPKSDLSKDTIDGSPNTFAQKSEDHLLTTIVSTTTQKTSVGSSFPISNERETHESQYTSRPEEFQAKSIDLKSLRELADLKQSSSTLTSTFGLPETDKKIEIVHQIHQDPKSDLPRDVIDRQSHTSAKTSEDRLLTTIISTTNQKIPVGSSFPISTKRESHESQYTSRPEEFQAKSIDLKSLRDSADLRQSSSTLTSTFGLPEKEKKIEIIHQILQDPKIDVPKDAIDRPCNTSAKKSEDHVLTTIISTTSQKIPVGSSFPISTERETHESQYTSRPGQLQAKSIDLNSLRDSADLRQSSSTLTSTFGLPEAEKKIEIVHQILHEAPKSDFPQHIIDRSSSAPAKDHLVTTITSRKTENSSDSYQKTSTIISNEVKVGANQSKEIIHSIVKEEKSSDPHPPTTPEPKENSSLEKSSPNEIIHKIVKETSSSDLQSKNLDHQTSQDESISSSESSVLTAIHNESPRSISPPPAEEPKSKENSEEKVAKRPMDLPPLDLLNQTQSASTEQKQDHFESTKVLNHAIVRQIEKPLAYRVESPQPEKLPMIMKKSKSFDDDDIVIQEMSDTSSAGDTDNPPLISEAESSETDTLEAADDFSDTPGTSSLLSIETLPMDHENDNSSPKSSADYKSRRQQNRAALESHFLPQFLAPNFLDSIKEENSDLSDSDRRSSCSDRFDPPVQHTDLDDDVFHNPPKKANAVYPKSNLDFSKKQKHVLDVRPPKTSIIREETPPPSVVEAKIIDQGSIEESCSSWSTDCTPESEAAEVVYIDSASSSVSDLLELDYSQGQSDETDPIDVRIQTPTIDLDSVNEMFATCQTKENNDSKIHNPQTEKPPPSPPVNEHNIEQEKINEQNLLPSHNKNDLPDTGRAKLENEVRETRKNFDEIIFENKETVSEKPPASADTQKNSDDVSSAAGTLLRAADENSIPNNSNSCESAIEPIVTSNYTSSVCVSSFVTVVVGSDKKENMENIREIVNASSKSELNKITDQPSDRECISKTNFIIGQPCSDHTLKSDIQSVTPTTTTNNNNNNTITTTTSTKILTLHDLSQALDNTKHLHNPLVSPCSTTALDRQESFDSHGSDQSHSTNQSQCTAINQGSLPHCDWNEFDTSTDTTYVSESDTGSALASSEASSNLTAKDTTADETESPKIQKLRLLCTEALASMPYGQEVLEELATVAKNIQEMPYPLPDLPQIQDIQLSLGSNPEKSSVITLSQVPPTKSTSLGQKLKSPPPPPVPEPPSKYDSDSWLGVPSESDPNVLVCLSPSQRNAVNNDSTADSLLDMHKKFVERRGYHEYTTKQVNAINQANSTSADAPPKLSKIGSPPPPPLPPRPPTAALTNPNGNTDTNDINDDEEDQNNHRLLAIIRDTHESKQQNSSMMTSTTSENISRRTESGIHHHTETSQSKGLDKEFAKTPSSVLNKQSPDRESAKSRHSEKMQQSESEHVKQFVDGETVLGMRFPTSEYFDSIFDGKNKRFSNIETGSKPTEFCSQILATQPKRYSNIETSSFESKKYVENGKVLYDVSDSQKQKIVEGDQPDASVSSVGASVFPEISKPKSNGMNAGGFPLKTQSNSDRYASGDSENIMSAFKLNSTAVPPSKAQTKERSESSPPAPPVPPLPPTFAADTTATSSMATKTKKSTSTSESHINRTFNAKTSGEKTFDDFGQRAKEAASTNTPQTTTATANAFQHEKLFKEFDELSNLLKDELDSGKRRPPATLNNNDIPASVIDYNRVARESKIQHSHVSSTTSSETHRREQMKKLADEIDSTAKHKLQQRREMRIPIAIEKPTESAPRSAPILPSQQPRTYEIPVQVENGRGTPHPSYQQQRSYEIPVQVERQSSSRNSRQRTFSEHQSGREIPIQVEKATPDRFRRAESMFNISDSTSSRQHLHHDEWMKYVGDLGSSENICKPFQREVEICYLGRRSNIRAPRMSASTSDLSNIQTFDTHGAYDVRRTAQTLRPRQPPRPAYLSTQSMIDTTPITPCVSSRRSPAPERRSSLPRELHDKQLQYITSKEQQLKYEFERLENERRQLIDEMNRVQMNQRLNREAYRQRQLPPLTEDESFRQQMAEEWLNKVAEREERRLQKIIKISKVNQEAGMPVAPPRRHSVADDIGDEFLRRVKERRSKLCMPSDSDWESGAESQPMPRTDGSRSETDEPPVTVFEGHSTANIEQLPKHLREFAKLTSQMKEEHREEITENTLSSASKMTSFKTTVKTSNNNHEQTQSPSQSTFKDAAHVRELEKQQQLSNNNGKRPKLVTILRHRKPAESASGGGSATYCEQLSNATAPAATCSGNISGNNTNPTAIKRRKQTRFLLTPNRRSWSESDLLREIDKDLVLAKGFLYANESSEMFAPKFKATAPSGSGVWTPKNQTPTSSRTNLNDCPSFNCISNKNIKNNQNSSSSTNSSPVKDRRSDKENRSSSASGRNQQKAIPTPPPPPPPPLWTPQPERKQFRPVHFESPTPQRKYTKQQSTSSSEVPSPPWSYTNSHPFSGYQSSQSCTNLSQKDTAISWPPVVQQQTTASVSGNSKGPIVSEVEDNDEGFPPTTSIADKIRSFERSNSNNELHRPLVRHNPNEKPAILKPNEVIFSVKNEYMSEPETEYDKPKKMAQLSRRQYDGIGPTTKHGMPLVLRSEVKEPNQHEWYKRIFQTIHKQKNPGRYPYKANGYMSEPEPNYDSDYSTVKYRTLERRRLQSTGTGTESRISAAPTTTTGNESQNETFYGTMPNPVKSGQGSYKVQPGRIENYITGHSSVSEKEKKEWWDEVMDIFNGQLEQQKLSPHYTEGNLSRALLKEQGYTSDSNLVFRKKDVPILQSPLSPVEQKQVYKSVQAGGQPPLFGFRKPAPEKPKETEFEYLPITPTLTKIIRVHSKESVMSKNRQASAERGEFISYPITNIPSRPIDVFTPFPKHVPSFIPLHQAPMPPNRKSSRVRTNSMALKISSSQVRRPTSANSSRHEACFQTKDAMSPPPPKSSNKYGTITLRKTVKSNEPLMRSKSAGAVVSILSAAKEEKSGGGDGRISRKHQSVRLSSCSPVRSASKLSTFRATSRSPVAFGRSVSKERSFAEEKKRIEETMPSVRTDFTASTNILRDPRLKSPDQVKRAVRRYALPIERSKSAPRVLPPIKPAMSSYISTYVVRRIPSPPRRDSPKRGQSSTPTRSLTKTPAAIRSKSQSTKLVVEKPSKPLVKTSSTVSLARTSSTFSVDSVSPKTKAIQKKPLSINRPTSRSENEKPKRKPLTIVSSKSDSNVLKKIRESPEITKKKIVNAIPMQQKMVRTNQFFQNLLMRDNSPKREEPVRQTSVHEKARYWNTISLPPKRAICDARTITYRSLSPPARPSFMDEYESVEHFHSDDEASEFGDSLGRRTEDLVWQYEQRNCSEPRPLVKSIKTVCDIARPESPTRKNVREFSPTREIRVPQTREMRSPSRRRIQNVRESQRGETGKVIRASSLSSADDRSKRSLYNCDDFAHSANSLEYIERHSPNCRLSNSERFIDLNRFYSTLERVGQLERATSAGSLKPIRKEGEPLDFEEWRKIRFHERAEKELSYLVGKLKEDQKNKDFLFRPKDVEDVKWDGNRDLTLKSKEKSVEDLRGNFEKKIQQEWLDENKRLELESKKDTYKPYWRGSSVVDLASNMEIKYNSESGSYGVQKTRPDHSAEKPMCLSNRLMSTLSKDQVSKITKQLNEIYNASEPRTKPDVTEEYVITVDKPIAPTNALKVRCNSSISKEELIGPVLRRKEASEKPAQSKKIDSLSREFKTELTEADKKRLSQNFSREIQGKARDSSPIIVGRETRGAIAAENAKLTPHEIPPPPPLPAHLNEPKNPAPPKPKRKPADDQKTEKPSEDQGIEADLTSLETTTIEKPEETVSKKIQYFEDRRFEESPKTIYHAREDSSPDEDEIMRVIEANIKARAQSNQYHHQEMSSSVTDLKDLFGEKESSRINFPIPRLPPPPDETIYHETKHEQNRSTSLTLRATHEGSNEELETLFRSRSASPQSKETSYLHRVNTGEVRKITDKFESLGRQKKKKHFFELSPLRKVRSDPELRNDGSKDTLKTIVQEHGIAGDVPWMTHKFEVRQLSGRGRSRVRKPSSPIQRMPIRKEDRLMPHIDIISKTASLKQEMSKSRSPSPVKPTQKDSLIHQIRSIFETSPDRTSPVGQPRVGTSSPDLRDISPHLTASWIAHKFPRPLDNDLRSPPPPPLPASPKPEKLAKSDSLPMTKVKRHVCCYRSRSISPPKSRQKQVISILKPKFDFFANQKFDPLKHRPKATYVPDSGNDPNLTKKSSSQIGIKKMTAVKFKDDDDEPPTPPVPPTKGVPLPLDLSGSYNLESPNRYFESDVNIHYKTPIRYEYKDPIPEEELAIRQAETMQKLYQEERRRKYLQELQDMSSRRHTDNFTPSQKSPIPLNRYDDFNTDLAPKSPNTSNYPRTVARALYNFQGQTARELTFKKGDVIYIRRQIDKNWYEGEHNAMIGLLPSNYVELLAKDGIRQPPKKPSEGQARAKYNFQAQSGIELSLNKGEHVTLTRRVDENWYEGKIANRKGIFPVSYVEVLVDIGADDKTGRLPATQSIITQSSSSAMRPSLDTLRTNINNEFNSLTSNGQPPNGILRETRTLHKTEVLHVDTNTEPVAYRALYKYRPQNTDELELQEGDIVFVLEKCDDGWFVGTSQRSGCFGTFPGNYVERV